MSINHTFQVAALLQPEDSFLKLAIALLSVLSGVLVAVLAYVLNQRAAKRAPKTEMRAEAYCDFVEYCARHFPDREGKGPCHELDVILSRLVVFGESEVVTEVANFMKGKRDAAGLSVVVETMRGSVKTANHREVMESIKIILESTSSGVGASPPRKPE